MSGETETILDDHTSLGVAFGTGNEVFFGVVDDAGFDTLAFFGSNNADSVFFDDASFAFAAAPVPGPLSGLLLVTALGAFALARRRA